ncbi:MAG: hypothetical protein ACTHK3_11700 [Solirubrobacterales bacterium]
MPKRRNEGEGLLSPRLAALAFALLVLATVVAFAYAQRVKRDPLVLDRVTFVGAPRQKGTEVVHSFTPNGDCRFDLIRIRFRTTVSGQGTVQVIKPGGRVVLTLARGEFLKRYSFHTYYWDGRQRNDGIAPPGRYKLRVKFDGRTLVTPGAIHLHASSKQATPRCASAASESEPSGVGQKSDAASGAEPRP